MNQRSLGHSGLHVSAIGYGCMGLTGVYGTGSERREMSDRDIDDVTGVETTGHEWDGIKELNNPLPRWWLWTFYASIVFAIGYTIAFPAWPLISAATPGLLGYSSRADHATEIAAAKAAQGETLARIAQMPVGEIFAPAQPARWATPISTTTNGSGAARSTRFIRPSPTAPARLRTPTRTTI